MNDRFQPEHGERPDPLSLERLLRRDEHELTLLAEPGRPLTRERLRDINELLLEAADEAEHAGIGWPDEASAVSIGDEGVIARLISTEQQQADWRFTAEIMAEESEMVDDTIRRVGFNNFPALLRSRPVRPREGESIGDFMANNPSAALYGSKPYLWRAYMLKPDFMEALSTEVVRHGGPHGWNAALLRAAADPEHYPQDVALLRASRLAYVMIANLMRTDDLERQYDWLSSKSEHVPTITDPEVELWT